MNSERTAAKVKGSYSVFSFDPKTEKIWSSSERRTKPGKERNEILRFEDIVHIYKIKKYNWLLKKHATVVLNVSPAISIES